MKAFEIRGSINTLLWMSLAEAETEKTPSIPKFWSGVGCLCIVSSLV